MVFQSQVRSEGACHPVCQVGTAAMQERDGVTRDEKVVSGGPHGALQVRLT
jgi:hypothetical protein